MTGGFLRRKHHVAVEHVSFAISADRPSITAIAGESCSGKTTLARLILGIVQPSTGEILYNGKPVGKMDRGEWRTFRREVQARRPRADRASPADGRLAARGNARSLSAPAVGWAAATGYGRSRASLETT